ncbi:putative alpha/Beta hydrolase [Helianthus annuus]|nr:putative alpha/Beta hydrolase [Helianthus annuus]
MSTIFFCNGSKWVLVCARAKYECINYITSRKHEGSVHIWQGDEDILVPATLQRNIAQQLPWINYHELTGAGHMFPYAEGNIDAILKALLLGQS